MNTSDRLEICRKCRNHSFDSSLGDICRLTSQPADFEDHCVSFEEELLFTEAAPEPTSIPAEKLVAASKGKRFANYCIDLFALLVINFFLGSAIGVGLALFSPNSLSIFEQDEILINYIFGFFTAALYYTISEGVTGRSIGKLITGTKVVDLKGEKPGIGRVFFRSICRNIPFDAFSFLGAQETGWHDRISKTRVVEIEK